MGKKYPIVKVPKRKGQSKLEEIKEQGILDKSRSIREENGDLIIPVKEGGNDWEEVIETRSKKKTPYEKIKENIDLPERLEDGLPDRWEIIGDILLIKIPESLYDYRREIGRIYADELGMDSVYIQRDIEGIKRKPNVERIYGQKTETVHLENGIKFKLDVTETMFSSGNIDERIRMSKIVEEGEKVVDMFAGIGYFSLPMAVHGQPETIYSLEINPVAFNYLKENVLINDVKGIVKPWEGNNRNFPKTDIADRIVMGYLHDTWKYLPKAEELLNGKGIIHYHSTIKDSDLPEGIHKELKKGLERDYKVTKLKKIKSYAPHVFHIVADISI